MKRLRRILQKLIVLLVILLSCGLFLRQAIICIDRFISKETQINLDILSTSTANFPHITLCPDYQYAYKEDILKLYDSSPSKIRDSLYPKVQNMTSYEFHDFVTFDLEEVLDFMEISVTNPLSMKNGSFYKVQYLPDPDTSDSKFSLGFDHKDWTTQRYKTFGRCYSFKAPKFIQRAKIEDIAMVFKRNSVVYLHHVGQFFSMDGDTKLNVELGRQFFMDTRHEITIDFSKEMSEEQKKEQNSLYNITCDNNQDFGFDTCLVNALDTRSIESFGCTFPALTNHKEKSCDAKVNTEKQLSGLNNFEYFRAQTYSKDCPQPCSTMSITFGFPIYDIYDANKGRVKMYFKSQINVRKNVVSYDEVNLLAEIGGYIGLLLGFSLLDIAKLFRSLFEARFNTA